MWSGGKDSTLATYAAVLQGHEISGLVSYSYKQTSQVNLKAAYKPLSHIVNFARRTAPSVVNNIASVIYRKDLSTMIPHVISSETIAKQAEAIELPLIHGEVTWDTIDQFIKISIKALKDKGIEGVVFGVAPPHFQ
jgi:diphthamide synthase (EF-2-diphthine--ammonia ligase)